MIRPASISKGDTVAIVSPASRVNAEFVRRAAARLTGLGFGVRVMPHALGEPCGSYAATEAQRIDDFMQALCDPDVKAIICSRGGYGCVHLLQHIPLKAVADNAKWLTGFSDVSALHALFFKAGVMSVHGPMARYIADAHPAEWLSIMQGARVVRLEVAAGEGSVEGMAQGQLVGGNLAVLEGLAATPYDIFAPSAEPRILFLEDVGEAIYRTERMLWRLYLSGALQQFKGLIIGQFTESRADDNFPSTAAMINLRLRQWGIDSIPVAADFPVGHIPQSLPLVEGAETTLSVAGDKTILTQSL